MTSRIYLDYNASAPLANSAKTAMAAAFELSGNPSSVHSSGRHVRAALEQAREQLAEFVGVRPQDVIWTSGGTEANNLALTPSLFARDKQEEVTLYVSAIEHPSVLNGMRFPKERIKLIPVTPSGVIDLAWLESELTHNLSEQGLSEAELAEGLAPGSQPLLVSVMLANNETGVLQPIKELSELVHKAGGLLHSDCVQGFGKHPIHMDELGADLISVSAHKVGGPQGVGALIVRDAGVVLRDPLVAGGGQELKRRGGTENVLGIVGFGAAIEEMKTSTQTEQARLQSLRDDLEAALQKAAPDAVIFGKGQDRLPHVCCFGVAGMMAETQVIQLDLAGIAVSSGSACSSGKVEQSHVLKAMGVDEALSFSALRVSLGADTKQSDLDEFVTVWTRLYQKAKPDLKTDNAAA